MTKIKNFVLKHPELFTILGLSILFYFIFFHNIWAYALMDVDETRYVTMSKDMFHTKDFLTLYLNKQFFFEKPPLYFWGECLSFAFWGRVTEFTARFPVALDGMLCCFTVYFLGKRIISRGYGVVSSLIFATSLEFLILAKFAILDIVVATCIGFSLCFGIFTNFCKEKHKKYCWWLFYIFSGLAVMAKGIPGFVIPFGSMFFISLYSKNFKEIFKPLYFIPGIILFLLITLPWHIIMLKMHDPMFFDEYIVKHHIERFIGGNELGREQPFYFYILTLLWGFFPWIFSVLACLGGYIWTRYIEKGEYSKIINITVYILGGIFILASIIALFTPLYLPAQLNSDIASAKPLCISLLFIAGLASIIFAKKEKYIGVFFTYVLFMLILSAFGTEKFFEIDYKFGQDDLMRFAEYAKVHNKTLTAYKFDRKYSLIFYSGQPVEYGLFYNIEDLKNELKEQNNLVIVQYKHMNKDFKNLNYKVIDKGRKYMLIEKR